LKSDNVMLSEQNGGDWAKVLDFGIAKIQEFEGNRDHDITAPNLVIGTPQYMSPEQCSQSTTIDARSDIYSLGIIIYEMLAGQLPFTGESPTVIMMKQVQDPPPSILEVRPDLPATISALISKSLAKQPADRFQSAGELSAALSQAAMNVDASQFAAPVTTPNSPVSVVGDEDEVTVVQPREVEPVIPSTAQYAPMQDAAGAPLAGVRPWRILAPAAIALVAVFALVFFMTRGSSQNQSANANVNAPGLSADPNSQPVQSTGTPTGESERNIQPQPISAATPQIVISDANANLNNSVNANTRQQSTPATVIGNFGANANQDEAPTPKPTPRKVDEDAPPPPKPTASVRAVPKPTASPIER